MGLFSRKNSEEPEPQEEETKELEVSEFDFLANIDPSSLPDFSIFEKVKTAETLKDRWQKVWDMRDALHTDLKEIFDEQEH